MWYFKGSMRTRKQVYELLIKDNRIKKFVDCPGRFKKNSIKRYPILKTNNGGVYAIL